MNEPHDLEDRVDRIARIYKRAYGPHAGESELAYARSLTATIIADHARNVLKHETTVRMTITPDVADHQLAACAAELGIEPDLVYQVLCNILGQQLVHAQKTPLAHTTTRDLPAALNALTAWPDQSAVQQFVDAEMYRDVEDCPFCDIIRRGAPAETVHTWPDAIAIVPINPVTPGHVLVIPRTHVLGFTADPDTTALAARRAAELAAILDPAGEYNVITSEGPHATQTIDHLHLHLVPRREGDNLALPWRPAPVEITATKCAQCGMRLGHVNYRGHVLGWGCAEGDGYDDRLQLAPQLGKALIDLIDRCAADDDEAPIEAMVEAIANDHRIIPDAGPALADVVAAVAQLLRRTRKEQR